MMNFNLLLLFIGIGLVCVSALPLHRVQYLRCPAGQRISCYLNLNDQTFCPNASCVDCEMDTFNTRAQNVAYKCAPCSQCSGPHVIETAPCTKTSDRQCRCEIGYKNVHPDFPVCVEDTAIHKPNDISSLRPNLVNSRLPNSGLNIGTMTPSSVQYTSTTSLNVSLEGGIVTASSSVWPTHSQPKVEPHVLVYIIAGLSVIVIIILLTFLIWRIKKKTYPENSLPQCSPIDKSRDRLLGEPYNRLRDKDTQKLIEKMSPTLLGIIAVDPLVLCHLVAEDVINEDQRAHIVAAVGPQETVYKLLSFVKLKGTKGLQVMAETFSKPDVNQKHVAETIENYVLNYEQ